MAFAAGVLVATALADLLPEASGLIGGTNPAVPGTAALVGFLAFSAIEAFVHRQTWEHQHNRSASELDPDLPHEHAESFTLGRRGALGFVGPASLIVHSTLDGLAIGLAFRADAGVGLLVAVAVLAHDFADGMNVVTLSLAAGQRSGLAGGLLVVDALAPVLGAAIGSFADLQPEVLGYLLAVFAGVFLAVGAGHLLPEAEHHRPGASPVLVLLTAVGAGVVVTIRSVLG